MRRRAPGPARRCLRAIACLLPVAALAACARPERVEPPNIVLISIDTLRADHLGAYGYARDTSPNIDALARRGVLFEKAFTPAPWTLPAHASMLTGLTPYRHGAAIEQHRQVRMVRHPAVGLQLQNFGHGEPPPFRAWPA